MKLFSIYTDTHRFYYTLFTYSRFLGVEPGKRNPFILHRNTVGSAVDVVVAVNGAQAATAVVVFPASIPL